MIIVRWFALLSLSICSITANAVPLANFSAAQEIQIQKIVRDYLINNPQLLVQMMQKLQQQKAQEIISTNQQQLFFDPNSPVIGNPKGDVTVVEFLDYQCPHCKHADPFLEQLAAQDSNLRVVYKQLPIFGEISEFAARAALAAEQQNKYQAFHNALIKLDAPFTEESILGTARAVGLNVIKLREDMKETAIDKEIKNNKQLASTMGMPGTPAFIIASTDKLANAVIIPGDIDFDTLKQNIDAVRKKN